MNLMKHAVSTGVPNVSINPNTNIEDILALPKVPHQRNHKIRVKKMNKHFVKDVRSIHQFTVGNVVDDMVVDLIHETIDVKKGLYLVDGNTRALSKKQLDDGTNTIGYNPLHPVITTIVDIDTPQKLLDEYYSIDSSSATEISGDKLRGAIDALTLSLTSAKALAGSFGSALKQAYPGDDKDILLTKMAYFKNEIELLDECGIFNTTQSDLQNQHIYCASLIAAKLYSKPPSNKVKLIKTLQSLSRLEVYNLKTSDKKWNGVTAIIHQMVRPNELGNWYDSEYHKSTKALSWQPVVGFLLYCLENQMIDKLVDKKSGFRPSSWTNKYTETLETLELLYPTS